MDKGRGAKGENGVYLSKGLNKRIGSETGETHWGSLETHI